MVKPNKQRISITVPENFVGKQVEVIAFTVDEAISVPDSQATYVASEKVLAKDWLTAEDDLAWQDL